MGACRMSSFDFHVYKHDPNDGCDKTQVSNLFLDKEIGLQEPDNLIA